jgi:hypothetical protein
MAAASFSWIVPSGIHPSGALPGRGVITVTSGDRLLSQIFERGVVG